MLGLLNEAGDDNYKDLGDGNDSMRTKTQGALELYERDCMKETVTAQQAAVTVVLN